MPCPHRQAEQIYRRLPHYAGHWHHLGRLVLWCPLCGALGQADIDNNGKVLAISWRLPKVQMHKGGGAR